MEATKLVEVTDAPTSTAATANETNDSLTLASSHSLSRERLGSG